MASRAGGRTPAPSKPGGETSTRPGARRPLVASRLTPLDYKKMEASILEKNSEIEAL